jgi:hypothetical protein
MSCRFYSRDSRQKWRFVDFDGLNDFALAHCLEAIVRELVPGGEIRKGEYIVLDRRHRGMEPGSFKMNLTTGQWADFTVGVTGTDVVSFVAYARDLTEKEAAQLISVVIGVNWRKDTPP